jgi:hypothetical protein
LQFIEKRLFIFVQLIIAHLPLIMKKTLFTLYFFFIANFLFAQMSKECELSLKQLVESSSHYKKRFGKKDIFLNKAWTHDASSDGYNLAFTIYHENWKVGTFNRIVTYHLNGSTKKLSVEDTFTKYNSKNIPYNKNLLIGLEYCKKNGKLFRT